MSNILKGRYTTSKAFGVLDLGLDWAEQGAVARFAYVDLDVDKNGKVDDTERKAVKANLYSLAINAGASTLKDGKIVIAITSCLDFSTGGSTAKNDEALVYDKGEVIMISTYYRDKEGNETFSDPHSLTRMSFALLHFLDEKGLIV